MISKEEYLIIAPFIDAYNYVMKESNSPYLRAPSNISKLLFELCSENVSSKDYKSKVQEYISMLSQH